MRVETTRKRYQEAIGFMVAILLTVILFPATKAYAHSYNEQGQGVTIEVEDQSDEDDSSIRQPKIVLELEGCKRQKVSIESTSKKKAGDWIKIEISLKKKNSNEPLGTFSFTGEHANIEIEPDNSSRIQNEKVEKATEDEVIITFEYQCRSKLGSVTNLKFNGTKVTWDKPKNAKKDSYEYNITVYYMGGYGNHRDYEEIDTTDNYLNMKNYLNDDEKGTLFYLEIQAVSHEEYLGDGDVVQTFIYSYKNNGEYSTNPNSMWQNNNYSWVQRSDGKWLYRDNNGNYVTGWKKIWSEKYRCDKWYFFYQDGLMAENTWYQDPNNQKWYVLKEDGSMAQSEFGSMDGINWYYFKEDGSMACNEVIRNSYIDASGNANALYYATYHGR